MGTLLVTGHTPVVGACSPSSLQDEVQTLPGRCTQSPVGAHTPWSLGTHPGWCLWSVSSKMRGRHSLVGAHTPWTAGGEETGAVAAAEFPKVPLRVFFFLGKSSCLILWLPLYKEGSVTQPTSPARPGSVRVRAPHGPTIPSQCPQSPWVYHFVLIPLPETSSNQVSHGVAQALFGRGGSH